MFFSVTWESTHFFKHRTYCTLHSSFAFLQHFRQDDDYDDESSFWAREADGPSSSHPSTTGLTSASFESMIPVNTLIMARPDSTGPWPLTVQVSVVALEWTWLTLAANPVVEPCSNRGRRRVRGNGIWEEKERLPCILWLIKCYYPAQQEVPEK